MKNKKILVTTTTFPTFLEGDGTPPFVYELSRRLASREGLEIVVSTPYIKGTKTYEEKEGIKIYRYKYGFTSLCDGAILPNLKKNKLLYFQIPFFIVASFFNLKKLVEKESIDIIHAHWIVPQGFLAVLYKKLFRKRNLKIISTAHGADIFGLKSSLARGVSRFTLKNCDFCTVNSETTKRGVLQIFKMKNLSTIPMGVDLERFNRKESDGEIRKKYDLQGPLLLFVGSLRKEKGIEYLIQSMSEVLKRFPNSKLLIIGSGGYGNRLRVLTKQLNFKKNIIFVGGIANSELPEFYSASDISILPSAEYEGLGIVLVESLAAGTPVIGTEIGGIPDIIKNEVTGLLVEPKNSIELSNAIIRLLEDNQSREKLAQAGQEYVRKKFSWEIITNKFAEIFKNTI